MKGWKKIFHTNGNQKKAGVAILISDKIDFRIKKEREKQIQYANTYIRNLRGKKKGHEEPSGKTGIKTQTY